jgi:hypothetical protein
MENCLYFRRATEERDDLFFLFKIKSNPSPILLWCGAAAKMLERAAGGSDAINYARFRRRPLITLVRIIRGGVATAAPKILRPKKSRFGALVNFN